MPSIGASTPLILPGVTSGGTGGQQMVKSSAIAADTGWSSPATGGPQYRSGLWYDNRAVCGPSTVFGTSGNYSYYSPMFFPDPIGIAALAVNVSSNSTATTLSLGVMTVKMSTGKQQSLLSYQTTAAPASGVVSIGTSGLTVPAGWSFLLFSSNGTLNVSGSAPQYTRSPISINNASPANTGGQYGWYSTTAPPTTTATLISIDFAGFTAIPIVYFQAA